MRRDRLVLWGLWGVLTVLGSAGCTKPRTVLSLRVSTDQTWGDGATLRSLVVTVRRGGMDGPLRCAEGDAFGCPVVLRLGTGAGQQRLPLTFLLSPAEPSDRTGVWVEVLGCGGAGGCSLGDAVVSWSRALAYSSEQTETLEVFLTRGTGRDAGDVVDGDVVGDVEDVVDGRGAEDVFDVVDAPDVVDALDVFDADVAVDTGVDIAREMPCMPPRMECGGRCVEVQTDVSNCGACNRVCPSGQSCQIGACVVVCPSGQTACGTTCVDLSSNALNCGACGRACASGQSCVSGGCAVVCSGGRTACGTNCVDLNSDGANCGGCGRACRGDQACAGGVCSCPSGQTECSGRCFDLTREPQHCGRCGNACASGRCTSGVCDCPSGQTRCGTACVDTQTDVANCGACGRACRARGTCIAGACIEQRSCQTPGTPGCGVVDVVGGGPFTLGGDSMASGASTAQPGVSVGRFALDRYEVTVARFRRYWEAGHPGISGGVLYPGETTAGVNVPWNGPVVDPVVRNPGAASPNEWQRFCNWTVSATDRESHPINCVDWYTAQAFCVWDGGLLSTNGQTGRLPTEAEWEFAARGTEGRPWPWGTTMIASQACWNRCPVYPTNCLGTCLEEDAAFAAGATPAGVRHMVGNVWEWTADNYGPYSTTTSSDPCINRSGRQNPICNNSATGGRVIRGGSWSIFDVVANLRSASRDVIGAPVYRNDNRGFRCAGTLTE